MNRLLLKIFLFMKTIGLCACKNGYGGDDCSIDLLSPPIIISTSVGSSCDLLSSNCDQITLYVTGVVLDQNITINYYYLSVEFFYF